LIDRIRIRRIASELGEGRDCMQSWAVSQSVSYRASSERAATACNHGQPVRISGAHRQSYGNPLMIIVNQW
jgi:hypothetical protein